MLQLKGEMAERLKAPVLKTGKVAIPSRVRISVSPPFTLILIYINSLINLLLN